MRLQKEAILTNQTFQNKEEAIRKAVELLVQAGAVDEGYVDAMLDRENIVTTHMGNFVAIPHGTDEAKTMIKKTAISIIQVPHGVDFAPDEEQEKMAMMIFGLAGVGDEHLEVLSQIAIFCSEVANVVRLVNADSPEEIIQLLEEVDI
ncbi:PTS sugar transporter subunit IIA [Aerococcaceae bacterium DSM 111020]|nr:PTS sugar transporter subunit IIA [Aerococcaceae bacterium DSM 111020]